MKHTEKKHEGGHCHCHEHAHGHDSGTEFETGCSCGHGHSHEGENEKSALKKIIISLALFLCGVAAEHIPAAGTFLGKITVSDINVHKFLYLLLYMISYILCGKDVLKTAVRNIKNGQFFDEQFLMSLASVGAICIGEVGEAVAVMLFYNVGEFFQDYAVEKSKKSISALMKIRPDTASVLRGEKFVKVRAEEVKTGETIQVLPGERLPLDGIIADGESFMETSALTGESVPRKVGVGDEVFSGFVNQQGVVQIKVTKDCENSAVTRILKLTQEANEVKSKSEKFITRFSKIYTPLVCIAALFVAVFPPLFTEFFKPELFNSATWQTWIYRALSFLVVSCPCALVISVPLSFFGGIGKASRNGILIKGSSFIEALSKAETAVFDKTGTLTKGIFSVQKIHPAQKTDEAELLAIASHAEYFSNHPISKSLKNEHKTCPECETLKRENAAEISGRGVKILLNGRTVFVGNEKLMADEGIAIPDDCKNPDGTAATVVHVAEERTYLGYIAIGDEIKEDSVSALKELKKCGIKKTMMLTGDNEKTGSLVAKQLHIDAYFAELLPEDKVNKIDEIIKSGGSGKKRGTVIFTGDGINDSPVLSRADVGVSMGTLGSDAAIEASDVVIMDDNLLKLPEALKISKRTMNVVRQNIAISLGVKIAIMAFSAAGIAGMWAAVFGDVGVCVLAILNAMRTLK